MNQLNFDSRSDFELFETKIEEIIRRGKTLSLIYNYGEAGKWLLFSPFFYNHQSSSVTLWKELEPHCESIKRDLEILLKNETEIQPINFSDYPIVARVLTRNYKKFILIGMVSQVVTSLNRIHEVSSFLRRKCSFFGITGHFYVFLSRKHDFASYFLLKLGDVKLVIDVMEDLILGGLKNIEFLTFQDPKIEIARAIMAKPFNFFFDGKLEEASGWEDLITVLKGTIKDHPHPTLYEIGT